MNNTVIDILLVEDRPEDAELTILALKEHGVSNAIQWVKDGEEALDFLFERNAYASRSGSKRPRLVLLDLKMPKVDGIEVLRQIRINEKTRTQPVVVLTTSSEEQDVVNAYNLGVNSYILKPVGFENFLKSVKDLGYYWLLLNEPPK